MSLTNNYSSGFPLASILFKDLASEEVDFFVKRLYNNPYFKNKIFLISDSSSDNSVPYYDFFLFNTFVDPKSRGLVLKSVSIDDLDSVVSFNSKVLDSKILVYPYREKNIFSYSLIVPKFTLNKLSENYSSIDEFVY